MRISDWSSDVCSSDLGDDDGCGQRQEEVGPRLKGKRQAQTEGRTQNQRQRREQAIAAEIVDLDLVQGTGARRARAPPSPVLGHVHDLPFGRRTLGELGSARSEEHTSELQSLMRISYAVFCLNKKTIAT